MSAAIIAGKSYSLGKAKLEGSILACIKDWAETHLDEMVRHKAQVAALREQQQPRSGDGAVLLHSQIPVTLDVMLRQRIDRRWMDDDWVHKKVISLYRIGMVNPGLPLRRGW